MTEQEDIINEPLVLDEGPYTKAARAIVFNWVLMHLEQTDERHKTFGPDEVYVVWFSKVLGNWKALLSTTLPDGMYYEVSYDGTLNRAYLDAYKKFDNQIIYFAEDGKQVHELARKL